ncbi:uncharacterized protein B0I36DRAFT_364485 [Microdochium trichocladiopsis]|uniref:Uncharacterized protein n=1 Tax=Microdochium trichocladiopsis TaxID=1682393 RepID=A0A9P8XZZ3_9PEZI|nr:uncharacterized protein B0I36DRAFT_364485 [Microdochium trichocladiopsis]KAH7027253.1 hypothetical protein B0I36DRAFT_364485 [Microdochium trichocladiopsis]
MAANTTDATAQQQQIQETVAATAAASPSGFRSHLPDLTAPRFQALAAADAHSHARELLEHRRPPWLHGLYEHWMQLLREPFRGVTSDGVVKPGLYGLRDEGVDVAAILERARRVVDMVEEIDAAGAGAGAAASSSASNNTTATSLLRDRTVLHIDSPEWRTWSNPEFLISNKGIRLDEWPALQEPVMAVLKATLSPEGYDKAVAAMRINAFLGQLVNGTKVMNEWSYNFVLFGEPAMSSSSPGSGDVGGCRPWGWALYGHHLCLSVFLVGTQIVVSPWFTGAEPNMIDDGPWKGTRILVREEELGLQLIRSLGSDDKLQLQQQQAIVYTQMKDPAMPKGRWNHDDQRHLCGAYRDNRVVPYEGVKVADMEPRQVALVEGILGEYLLYLPARSRELKMQDVRRWYAETYFCWIGGTGDEDPFYYRIQSPVVLVEFDHHSGVFLNNEQPAKFHIHTLLRTPNGGDYGMALRRQVTSQVEQGYLWEG